MLIILDLIYWNNFSRIHTTKQNSRIDANDFKIIREIVKNVKHPVIGEGNIDTPSKVKRALELGCYSVVVGSMITRPQLITKKFVDEISR